MVKQENEFFYLQIESSKPWRRQRGFDSFWLCEALNCSTTFSTSRLRKRSSADLTCSDLHSGQIQLSLVAMKFERQPWQKLCPQSSVIRIGGVNMSFKCLEYEGKRFQSKPTHQVKDLLIHSVRTVSTLPKHSEHVKSSAFISLLKFWISSKSVCKNKYYLRVWSVDNNSAWVSLNHIFAKY